jgi:ubiquitin-like protein Pup
MAGQTQREQRTDSRRTEAPVKTDAPRAAERARELKAKMDEVLADIDEVLEDNAEEFVRGYVQRGGE